MMKRNVYGWTCGSILAGIGAASLVVAQGGGTGAAGGGAPPANPATPANTGELRKLPDAPVPPIDPQKVVDQDDMTWEDYHPIPGTDWADPQRKPTSRTIRVALIAADFDDQPFVITQPKKSDIFGNPQIDPIKREEVAKFYAEFWNGRSELHHKHTVNEYWMEQSHGRIGVEFEAFGPYHMPQKLFQYGLREFGQQNSMPSGFSGNGNLSGDCDTLWRADAGADVKNRFQLVLRMFAGYDETCVWQEFGEMKFQTRDDITPEFGNPDPTMPRWAPTRYVPWTSWKAAEMPWSNSAIINGESSGSIVHEISHAAFRIGDNNNNPYVQPYRRVGSGPWDIMDRGSFNGPGGPHNRWQVPVIQGGAMPAGLMLRNRMNFQFAPPEQVLRLNRNGLAGSGLAVARVIAREVEPAAGEFTGLRIWLDGDAPKDRTPSDDPNTNPLSSGIPNYSDYTLEVVQRIGFDSFCPDSGVLIAKNKEQASATGGTNGFTVFNWVIDAHPEDINKIDFKRPNGEVVMRTVADYRQLNDALFHAGLNSGSQCEWEDTPNRLHFYVVDVQKSPNGVLAYTLGVRSLDGAGPSQRGVTLAAGPVVPANGPATRCEFKLTNTGAFAASDAGLHPQDATDYLKSDIYRLEVSVEGQGWTAALPNALAAVKDGESAPVAAYATRGPNAAATATLTLTATSESDPTKKATAKVQVAAR